MTNSRPSARSSTPAIAAPTISWRIFLAHLLAGLIAYCHQPKKRSLRLDRALERLAAGERLSKTHVTLVFAIIGVFVGVCGLFWADGPAKLDTPVEPDSE